MLEISDEWGSKLFLTIKGIVPLLAEFSKKAGSIASDEMKLRVQTVYDKLKVK